MLKGLFQRKLKHERLEEEPEVRYKGLLVSEKDLGYTFVRPGGKTVPTCIIKKTQGFQLNST